MRSQGLRVPFTHTRCVTLKATKAQPKENLTHEERNAVAGRPMSPHLTIYAPQLTSMMSISHRIAGMALSGYAIVLATASFSSYDMAHIAQYIHDLHIPGFIIFTFKLMLGFPAAYHLCNGVRHLVWDIGKALTLKEVYLGGYITLAAAAALALYIAV